LSLTFFVANFIFISGIIYFVVESFHSKMQSSQTNLEKEKEKSESLLRNILPSSIIEELKETGQSRAKLFNHVSVLFTDFVNFTTIAEQLGPEELVAEIDYCFKGFDEICERNGLEKIKTIGDAYLAVCGMPNEDEMHAYKVVQSGLEIIEFITKRKNSGGKFDIRIGINSGPLVAGIVGVKKFAYDIWGDTVNTAARLESNSEMGKINISEPTYQIIKDKYECTSRGKISAKNKGEIEMYFVEHLK
jgi:adenylate cyclase